MKWLIARLSEGSTWVGLGAVVTGAVALPSPFDWLVIGTGSIAVLLKDKAT